MFWAQRANTCLSVTMPLRRLNICFQKKNIHGSPLVSRRERGERETLNSSLYKLPSSFLGANRSPLDGQQICQRVCLHLLLPTTPPPSLFNYHMWK